MGGVRWCKSCHTSHEGPTGSKCQRLEDPVHLDSLQEDGGGQASNSTVKDTWVTEEQARLVAQQVEGNQSQDREDAGSNREQMLNAHQDLILQELKNISQKFGKLEHQAAQDREVLTGLVQKVNQQSMEQLHKKVNNDNSSLFPVQGSEVESVSARSRKKSGTKVGTNSKHCNINTSPISITSPRSLQAVNGTSPQTMTLINGGVNVGHQGMNTTQHAYGDKGIVSAHRLNESTVIKSSIKHTIPMQVISTETLKNGIMTNASSYQVTNHTQQAAHSGLSASHMNCMLSSMPQTYQIANNAYSHLHTQRAPNTNATDLSNVICLTDQQQAQAGTRGSSRSEPEAQMAARCGHLGHQTLGQAQPNMPSQGQTAAEQVIPSLQVLRQSADINNKVQQRYRELEEASTTSAQGNLDILLEVLTRKQKGEKIKVKWPQDLAFIGSMRRRPNYEQLTTCQWLLGFLRIRQEESDPNIRENMIDYITELMQDACDYSWDSAKGAHAVLLHRMADGVVDWKQLKELHKIRKRYAQTTSTTQVQEKASKSQKVVPCLKFNKGVCPRNGDHEWKELLLKHMCHFCYSSGGKIEYHARKDCWKAPKEVSKNM